MIASTLIYFNKNQEEIARITFDDNGVPGWCIKSKGAPRFKRKFAEQREACAIWLREFDPETGKLHTRRKQLTSDISPHTKALTFLMKRRTEGAHGSQTSSQVAGK